MLEIVKRESRLSESKATRASVRPFSRRGLPTWRSRFGDPDKTESSANGLNVSRFSTRFERTRDDEAARGIGRESKSRNVNRE